MESLLDDGKIDGTTSFLRREGIKENLSLIDMYKQDPDKYSDFGFLLDTKKEEEWELKFLQAFHDFWVDKEFEFGITEKAENRDKPFSVLSTGEFSINYDDHSNWMLCIDPKTEKPHYIRLAEHKDAVLIPDEKWMLKSQVNHVPH